MKKFKKCWVFPVAVFVFFSFISSSSAKELKIGVVNIEKIYASFEKTKKEQEEIQKKRTEKQIELSKKQAELKALINEYNSKKNKLKEAEKKEYEKKIRDLRTEIQTFIRLSNTQLIRENRAKTQEILREIARVIQEYAKKNKYDIIIDKKSLPYFSSAYDISDDIIKILNKSQSKK